MTTDGANNFIAVKAPSCRWFPCAVGGSGHIDVGVVAKPSSPSGGRALGNFLHWECKVVVVVVAVVLVGKRVGTAHK